jgi:methionine-rich copper-binding protein CopC
MRRILTNILASFATAALVLLVFPTTALGHAERQSSEPKKGETLPEPPLHLYINYSEPPTGDASITVLDGCGNDVVANFEVTDRTIHANLEGGQPGRWVVNTKVISGVDGHDTSDRWGFKVDGSADCDVAASEASGSETDPGGDDGGLGSAALLAAGGVVVLIGVAAAIRLRSK